MLAGYNLKINSYSCFVGDMVSATGLLFVYTFDFARTRLGVDIGKTMSERQFKGMNDCLIKIYKADGIQGYF